MGIGRELIGRLKKKYKGYLYLVLIAENKDVKHFYEKMGFVALQERENYIQGDWYEYSRYRWNAIFRNSYGK